MPDGLGMAVLRAGHCPRCDGFLWLTESGGQLVRECDRCPWRAEAPGSELVPAR
jgi:hypothetical protein